MPNSDDSSTLEVDSIFAQDDAPLALLRLRTKTPDATASDEAVEYKYILHQEEHIQDINHASTSLRFATAVAEFAEILRLSPHVHEVDFDRIHELASSSLVRGDEFMAEFLTLVNQAKDLWDIQAAGHPNLDRCREASAPVRSTPHSARTAGAAGRRRTHYF